MDQPITELDEELAEFVETVMTPIYEYRTGGHAWCAKWWEQTEILNRLQDLCDGWNKISTGEGAEEGTEEDGIDLNTWYRLYLDRHMPIIINKESGPLRGCTSLAHSNVRTDQWAHPETGSLIDAWACWYDRPLSPACSGRRGRQRHGPWRPPAPVFLPQAAEAGNAPCTISARSPVALPVSGLPEPP